MQPDPGAHRRIRALTGPDLGSPLTLHLVRHASTAATGRVPSGGDDPGPPLNDEGRQQVSALSAVLGRRIGPVDLVLSSPMLRARQTASGLAGALGREPRTAPDWAELRLGEWNGLAYGEIARRWPAGYRLWQESPSARPPGGESVDDLRRRVDAGTRRLVAEQAGRCVVVVTHTGAVRAAVASALDAGPAAFWRLRVDPASLTTLRCWADGGVEVAAVNQQP
ncbi:histidine phosphatase family protein [Kineosporia sp. J2-2]|uniref:Histidine phosphatase family protein n=1 Tax=Kineosporia corallincola TaxID=2835133 RepID=A0ABS5TIW4_9ACTN|nr:histidine phosphatase family protein [Kineosporia corallincola]MBT0770950.1 histidine phosphatase family protein [Kineosporia corallincola]